MPTNIVNLHTLIADASNSYIAANAEVFKSTVPGDTGPQGPIGIDGAALTLTNSVNNGNGTFTLTFSDGSTHTTEDLRGVAGVDGTNGVDGNDGQDADALTVTDITMNPDYTLTLEFSDGFEYTTTSSIRGADGRNIHHIVHISSQLPNGDIVPAVGYGQFGEEEAEVGTGGNKDTYAAYADEDENTHVGEIVIQNGDSAYTYAVEGGFTGTREEFISLLGQVDDLVLAATTAITQSEAARDKAEQWAEEDEDVEVELGQFSAKHHAIKAAADAVTANTDAGIASAAAISATASEGNALTYSNAADTSAGNALVSENNAKDSETVAGLSETNALASENSASIDAGLAATSAANAAVSETNSSVSETNAGISEINAAASEVVVANALSTKQDILVDTVNIKTLNGDSVLGTGDLTISAGSGGYAANLYFSDVQSTINPAYKTLSYTADVAPTVKQITCNNGETAGEVYLFELPIDTDKIDGGSWLAKFHAGVSSSNGITKLRYEGFMRAPNGDETTLFTSESKELDNVTVYREFETVETAFTVDPLSRYGIRVFANTDSNSDKIVNYTVGDGSASYTNTPAALRHDQLRDRSREDSHPIEAITDLTEQLSVRGTYTESATEPGGSKVGDEWLDTTNEVLYKRVSDGVTSAWLQTNGSAGTTFTNATRGPITVTSDYVVEQKYKRVFVDASNSDVLITLPSAVGNINEFSVTRIDNSGNSVDVDGIVPSGLLDGETVDLASDGTQWRIV